MIYEMLLVEERIKVGKLPRYAMMSDKPGAGKTYAVLGFLYFADKVIFAKQRRPHNVNLIVIPYNICTQWATSMERIFGPSGTVVNYKILTEYADMITLYTEPQKLIEYDILLTTSLYFSFIASTMKSLNIKPRRVMFDEADTVKNLLMTELACDMTWFISASMQSLFPRNSDVVSIGNYALSMKHLQEYDVRCDEEFIHEAIVLERPIEYVHKCQNVYFHLLCKLIPDSTRFSQLAAMDYGFLRSEFVPEIRTIDSEYTACLYVFKDALARYTKAQGDIQLLQADIETLRNKIITSPQEKEDNDIRIANITSEIEHHERIQKECQRKLSTIRFFSAKYDVDDTFTKQVQPNEPKLDRVKSILLEIIETRKAFAQCIIFSNYDAVYSNLVPFLKSEGITYRYLDGGNIASMDTIIGAYKNREFSMLLADSTMYSCGMNLENTTDIVFLHKMEQQREQQVIGRAQRFGRNGVLHIWYVDYATT